jgi:hypothetical protein
MLFQSSPARGGGCNLRCEPQQGTPQIVSILTRPWGRVQRRQSMLEQARQLRVSILTRPWGRVQPVSVSPCRIHSALFQSSPARGGGCNIVHLHQKAGWGCFNPHPPVGAGATEKLERLLSSESCCFNPHPPVGAGATQGIQLLNRQYTVSILTRPWGRVQQTAASVLVDPEMFQSSPARGGGCNAANQAAADAAECAVSILTRPWGRVQRETVAEAFNTTLVSILTRPWGRVQRQRVTNNRVYAIFVSILTRPWGRVQRASIGIASWRLCRFNPHPPVGAGATYPNRCLAPLTVVSILTRPWGRVQLEAMQIETQIQQLVSILTRPWGRVQRTGRFPSSQASSGFNPHPPVGAGATIVILCAAFVCDRFNPHPPVGAGATPPHNACSPQACAFQSSPARGGGCNLRVRRRFGARYRGFNPHPPVGAGATRLGERAGAVPQTQVFQLSRCAVPRSGRLTAGHSPTDTRYAASRPWAGCPLAPSSR